MNVNGNPNGNGNANGNANGNGGGNGSGNHLSIARFTQEKGAASSFFRVVHALEAAFEERSRKMIREMNMGMGMNGGVGMGMGMGGATGVNGGTMPGVVLVKDKKKKREMERVLKMEMPLGH